MKLKKQKIFNVPNLLSLFRILLVPVFVFVYFSSFESKFYLAGGIVVFSALTDVLDGIIARKFNLITTLGKILDPIADKLTQGVSIICLSISNPKLIYVVVLLVVKELAMLLGTIILFKSGHRPSESKWWGKLSTVAVFFLLVSVLVADIVEMFALNVAVSVFSLIASVCLVFSLINYYEIYKKIKDGNLNGRIGEPVKEEIANK